jgi:hypothetical protein
MSIASGVAIFGIKRHNFLDFQMGEIVENLFEFNGDLLDELREESSSTGVPLDDLAFERLASRPCGLTGMVATPAKPTGS